MSKYTDETIMPFGKFKGEKLANVPAYYLLWLYEQDWVKSATRGEHKSIKDYCIENMDALKQNK